MAALAILLARLAPVALTYGPIAALLAELFPTAVRCTSMSVPYPIGNRWIGGLLPLVATAMAAATAIIGAPFLRDRRNRALD